MTMQKQTKVDNIAELQQTLAKVAALIVADFRGLKVEEVNGLRREIRKADCKYRVVKNTLFKRAVAGTPMEGLAPLFKGPTAIAYSLQDPVAPAKVMDKFSTTLDKLKLKGGYLDGHVLDANGVKSLAHMKGKDELRAELLATFLAPLQDMLRLLQAAPQNFLYLLGAKERSMGSGG
jgi:large subunit ribosomal protein L10